MGEHVVDTKNNIALVYDEQAKYPEALQMHREVLEVRLAECFDKCVVIYAKAYGDEHSATADARKRAARARA